MIIKSSDLWVGPGTVFSGFGFETGKKFLLYNQRNNLTKSSMRTKMARINFENIELSEGEAVCSEILIPVVPVSKLCKNDYRKTED